mgnify:CR=1 FL=1
MKRDYRVYVDDILEAIEKIYSPIELLKSGDLAKAKEVRSQYSTKGFLIDMKNCQKVRQQNKRNHRQLK